MVAAVKAAAKDGDSLGGVAEVLAYGVPVGLGSHVHWDRKLDALLAQALMSIQAVKAVEIGEGWDVAGRRGSAAHDAIHYDEASGRLPPRHGAGRGHRGRHVDRGSGGRPGGHEAAGHLEPAGARDGRRGDQGVHRQLQGAHRRHGGAGHGGGGRDDDGPGAGRRGPAQVRRRLAGRGACATATGSWPPSARPRRRPSARSERATRPQHRRDGRPAPPSAAGRDDGGRQDHGRAPGGRPSSAAATSTPTPRWRRTTGHTVPELFADRGRGRLPGGRGRRCWPRRWPSPGRWWSRWPAARCSTRPTGRCSGARGRWSGSGPARPRWPGGWATGPGARCSARTPRPHWPASRPCGDRSTPRWPTPWSTSTTWAPAEVAELVLAAAGVDR